MKLIKITKKTYFIIGLLLLSVTLLSACGNDSNGTKENTKNKVHKVENTTEDKSEEKSEEKYVPLDALNQLATLSTQTEEIYVTDNIVIGQNEEVKPGIYDLEITGGTGNISGDRSTLSSLFINWAGGAKENTGGYPSKIRMILFEGDTLKFSNISKVKFNAVPEKVEPSNELGIGEFIVGRDILPGDYKLSTNVKLNPEYENLGWSTTIYSDENGQSKDQKFTATNNDVVVSLKEGEVISISYDNTDNGSSSDDAKLIFTKM
jgi:predicted small secreted protein